MQQRTFDDFDEFADDYRNIHTENIKLSGVDSFYFAEMKVKLLKQFEQNVPARVLDLGCGDGSTELFIQQHFPHWQVTGIDVSEKSIAQAIQKNIHNAFFSVYDGFQIPVVSENFDVVFIAGVLHHVSIELHEALLKEMKRVLKKDGRVYLFEHNPLNPVTKHLVNTCVFDKDARLLRNSYTKKILRKNNLTVTNNQFIIFFPRKGFLSKLVFLEKYLKWLPLGGQYFIRAIKG